MTPHQKELLRQWRELASEFVTEVKAGKGVDEQRIYRLRTLTNAIMLSGAPFSADYSPEKSEKRPIYAPI